MGQCKIQPKFNKAKQILHQVLSAVGINFQDKVKKLIWQEIKVDAFLFGLSVADCVQNFRSKFILQVLYSCAPGMVFLSKALNKSAEDKPGLLKKSRKY